MLRLEVGELPDHGRPHQVMCELREASREFSTFWDARDVRDGGYGVKRIMNPHVGELVVTFEALAVAEEPHQRLCTYTAPKGSETEQKLRLLATGVTASL